MSKFLFFSPNHQATRGPMFHASIIEQASMRERPTLTDQLLLGSNLLKNVRPGQTFFELTTPMGHTYFFQKRHSDAQRWRSLLRTSPRTRPRKLPGSAGVTNKKYTHLGTHLNLVLYLLFFCLSRELNSRQFKIVCSWRTFFNRFCPTK